jgi:hypothetical protein
MADTSPPPKADSAPAANAPTLYYGLAQALNEMQKKLSTGENRKYNVPDEYVIEFAPENIGQYRCFAQGQVPDHSQVPMGDQSLQCRPDAQAVDVNSVTQSAHAGMQIVQFIDQIMRNSRFITNQNTYRVDQTDGNTEKGEVKKPVTWYKINFSAVPLQYDSKRNDFAYRMIYLVTPLSVVDMKSPYFNGGRYRGVHKNYDYWFTGENKDVLQYEQDFNKQWVVTISGFDVPNFEQRYNGYELEKRVYGPTSGASSAGRDPTVNEPQANGLNYLTNPADMSKVRLKIVGDPAWLQQGEASGGLNSKTWNKNAFNPDGSINFDASEICFRVNWNAPDDYDVENNGLMNISQNKNSQPQPTTVNTAKKKTDVSVVYIAISCKSTFRRGEFTQELEGRLFIEPETTTKNGRTIENKNTATRTLEQSKVSNESSSQFISQPVLPDFPTVEDQPSKILLPPAPATISGDQVDFKLQNGVNAEGQSVGLEIRDETGRLSTIRRNPDTGELYDATGLYKISKDT